MPQSTTKFKVSITKDEFDHICQTKLIKLPKCTLSISSEGYVIKENKTDLLKGTYAATANIIYADGLVSVTAKCAGFGPIQKNHVAEFCQIIKNTIERSIIEKLSGTIIPDDVVRCPRCGSTQIQLQKRGWSIATGLIASGKNERVCLNCLYKF